MSLKWNTRRVDGVMVVDVEGRITLGEGCMALRDSIRHLLATGERKLLLNLAGVAYMDSSGIGELIAVLTAVTKHSGSVKLLNPTKRVRDVLQMTQAFTLFQVFADEDAAVRSYSG